MPTNVKNMKMESNYKRPPALESGAYAARTVQMVSRGLQKQDPYLGEEKPPKPELYITYELADEFLLDEDGNEIEDKPRWISETIPLNSLDSDLAKSTQRYYALDPNVEHGGEFLDLVDIPCLLTIVQKTAKKSGNVYNTIKSVSSLRPKDQAKAPALVNGPKVFDFDEPDYEVFKSLPEWLQGEIKESLDYGGSKLEQMIENGGAVKDEKPKTKPEPEQNQDDGDEDW